MTEFTPVSALTGGVLIGAAASLLLLGSGRVAGISGIFGGLLRPRAGDALWRLVFVLGLATAGIGAAFLAPWAFGTPTGRPTGAILAAGLLVGFGVRMGHGCTSGHGVCGLSRQSPRSLAATVTFMLTGALTALVARLAFGGAS